MSSPWKPTKRANEFFTRLNKLMKLWKQNGKIDTPELQDALTELCADFNITSHVPNKSCFADRHSLAGIRILFEEKYFGKKLLTEEEFYAKLEPK